MYDVRRGDTLIVMLGGGATSTHSRDIAKAMALADAVEESHDAQED